MNPLIWLPYISPDDQRLVGGKALNLARMLRIGLPVPPGFCIPTTVFEQVAHMELSTIRSVPTSVLNSIEELQAWSDNLQKTVLSLQLPIGLEKQVLRAFDELLLQGNDSTVAVRSSGVNEDSATASFAGQYTTLLSVPRKDVINGVKRCWASLYSSRVISYSKRLGLDLSCHEIAVIIQLMINAESSGVMFTKEPMSNRTDRIVIEAISGLGDKLVSGEKTPDRYVFEKGSFSRLETVENQSQSDQPLLSHGQLLELARTGLIIELEFGRPQDIEWAFENDSLFILQTRPITS